MTQTIQTISDEDRAALVKLRKPVTAGNAAILKKCREDLAMEFSRPAVEIMKFAAAQLDVDWHSLRNAL